MFQESKIMNFCKRSYQPILRLLYVDTIKRRGKISLHKHLASDVFVNTDVSELSRCRRCLLGTHSVIINKQRLQAGYRTSRASL